MHFQTVFNMDRCRIEGTRNPLPFPESDLVGPPRTKTDPEKHMDWFNYRSSLLKHARAVRTIEILYSKLTKKIIR